MQEHEEYPHVLNDKVMLRMRSIIETINDQPENICMTQHLRDRSFHNFINNLLAGLIAYSFLPKKPAVKIYEFQPDQSAQCRLFQCRTQVICYFFSPNLLNFGLPYPFKEI